MPFGLDASIWTILLLVLVLPILAVGLLNVILRNRGGVSASWGGVLVILLGGIVALLIIFDKVRI